MIREQMRARRDEVIAKARSIALKAKDENRGLTAAEQANIDQHVAEAKSINETFAAEAKSQAVMAGLDAMAAGLAGKSGTDDGRRLSFKGMAAGIASNMLGGPDGGTKALAPSGATVVGQEFTEDPIPLGRAATGLLDVLQVVAHNSPAFSYLRQGLTGRTNNAAVVADGAVKPTTLLGVERIDNTLSVVAHLSELVPRYWLIDNVSLQRFVDNELRFGLGVAVEAKVIADINGTSGIQTQTFSTSALVTIRKSLTKLEGVGLVAGAIVLHPTAFESIELALSSTNAVETRGLPFDPASRQLFGVPIVVTVSEAVGFAHVLSVDAVAVDTDHNGVAVQWSENSTADSFSRNQIQARCEGRYATSVYRPLGVVKAAVV